MLQREFVYCYLYVVMLLKSLHYSVGQPVILSSGVDVNQQLVHRPATTPCSDAQTDDDGGDTHATASGER